MNAEACDTIEICDSSSNGSISCNDEYDKELVIIECSIQKGSSGFDSKSFVSSTCSSCHGEKHQTVIADKSGNVENGDSSFHTKTRINDSTDRSTVGSQKHITHQSSAYVQNLAEICHDILHDARWRISKSKRLFQWESGDDLSALIHFSRLFLSRGHFESNGNSEEIRNTGNDDVYARCMNLYSRLFYRKGPWFHIHDVFFRYYHRCDDNTLYEKHEIMYDDIMNFRDETSKEKSKIQSNLENSIKRCMADICRLHEMGLIRSFASEEECASVVGEPGSKLLTEKEKMHVLGKLGVKSSKEFRGLNSSILQSKEGAENTILKQIKSQKTILFKGQNGNQVIPVIRHVNGIIFESWRSKLVEEANGAHRDKSDMTDSYLKELWKSVTLVDLNTHIDLFTCVRLREDPLYTLRRACRLYLCAGDGPGSMRYTGANAWIPVHEGKESFFVQRQKEKKAVRGVCNLPEPPTASLWNQVEFHGLKHRMGLAAYNFAESYSRMNATMFQKYRDYDEKTRKYMEVFSSHSDFKMWELCAEIRCVIDYLMEWNRMILYADRKIRATSKNADVKDHLDPCVEDSLHVLSVQGRATLIKKFMNLCRVKDAEVFVIQKRVEDIIQVMHQNSSLNDGKDQHDRITVNNFQTDAERMIAALGVICHQILIHRLQNISLEESKPFLTRPWLRHLHPDSVLAYIVWDCVETLEKRGFHNVAVDMLETILFGINWPTQKLNDMRMQRHFCQHLLSRRVRGKALERLLIDKKHFEKHRSQNADKEKNKRRKVSNIFDDLTTECIRTLAYTASVPFSFIRKCCKKIKIPMLQLLGDAWSVEILELGFRMHESDIHKRTAMAGEQWVPKMDISFANALLNDDGKVGKRCSFLGPDEIDGLVYTRALNVEELALEEYAAGRLPIDKTDTLHQRHVGKWKGWHSEGVHVRVLFRILCHAILLGSPSKNVHDETYLEQLTVFLNSYQGAPLDLHVGHSALIQNEDAIAPFKYIRGIYTRQRREIDQFLMKLEQLSSQELSDLVFESINSRFEEAKKIGRNVIHDPTLLKDLKQMRTLSMLAAGFGGKLLASMFRLLFFDYRHYGAGLPDLLLVRAFVQNATKSDDEQERWKVIDLGEWIGEVFQNSPTAKSEILYDMDDGFLGGSLHERKAKSSDNNDSYKPLDKPVAALQDCMPERLILSYEGCPVSVECLFVEVKSHNDKLDVRQEDWLNTIGKHGNARICKFQSPKNSKI